jgi:hypothetical protein
MTPETNSAWAQVSPADSENAAPPQIHASVLSAAPA